MSRSYRKRVAVLEVKAVASLPPKKYRVGLPPPEELAEMENGPWIRWLYGEEEEHPHAPQKRVRR